MKGEARWQQLEQTADHGSSQFFLNGGLQGSFEPRRMHCCLQRWQLLVVVGVHLRRCRLIANFSRATLHVWKTDKVKHKVPTYNSFGNTNLSKKVSVVTAEMTDVRSKTHLQRDMMRSKTDKSKMCIPKRTLSFFLFCTTNQAAR